MGKGMAQDNSAATYYKNEYKKLEKLIETKCQTVEQNSLLCALALERYYAQFVSLNEQFLDFDLLTGYKNILSGMEHCVCDGVPITIQMVQLYLDWCLSVTKACEEIHISCYSPVID